MRLLASSQSYRVTSLATNLFDIRPGALDPEGRSRRRCMRPQPASVRQSDLSRSGRHC